MGFITMMIKAMDMTKNDTTTTTTTTTTTSSPMTECMNEMDR
jgi:hypothetical protein